MTQNKKLKTDETRIRIRGDSNKIRNRTASFSAAPPEVVPAHRRTAFPDNSDSSSSDTPIEHSSDLLPPHQCTTGKSSSAEPPLTEPTFKLDRRQKRVRQNSRAPSREPARGSSSASGPPATPPRQQTPAPPEERVEDALDASASAVQMMPPPPPAPTSPVRTRKASASAAVSASSRPPPWGAWWSAAA